MKMPIVRFISKTIGLNRVKEHCALRFVLSKAQGSVFLRPKESQEPTDNIFHFDLVVKCPLSVSAAAAGSSLRWFCPAFSRFFLSEILALAGGTQLRGDEMTKNSNNNRALPPVGRSPFCSWQVFVCSFALQSEPLSRTVSRLKGTCKPMGIGCKPMLLRFLPNTNETIWRHEIQRT